MGLSCVDASGVRLDVLLIAGVVKFGRHNRLVNDR